MYFKQRIGKEGEEISEKYLSENGYKILERNFCCKMGEIDIIALYKKQLIFVEIKTRRNIRYGLPSEAVTKNKLKHIYKTAEYYLYIKKLYNVDVRIDVIEVYFKNEKEYKINHIKQVI